MTEENKKPDYIGNTIVFILLGLLLYAGFLSYKSIDWDVLKRLENTPLVLPTPIPTITATSSATTNSSQTK
ncbi:MAG: hypothetical protein PHN66_03260 [Candidatus Shapirobacteria bacterium]|nr:hypothetical protein [Candidatus Shapirobacteria bacterium]